MVFSHESAALYERACQLGWWYRLGAWLCGRPARLLDAATLVAHSPITASHYLGYQTVPIAQIRGSEGRRDLFDDAFYPRETYTRTRWLSIATAWLHGVALPRVELIRLGEIYVVRDGHHRISVQAAVGNAEVEAVVTAWSLAPTQQ